MALLFGLLILALLAIPLVISIQRSNELFCVTVAHGKATFRRGHLPQRLLDDINDVVSGRPKVRSASIRVVQERGHPQVRISGQMSDGQKQRLRNVVGAYSLAKIKAGGRPARAGRPKRRRGPTGRRS